VVQVGAVAGCGGVGGSVVVVVVWFVDGAAMM